MPWPHAHCATLDVSAHKLSLSFPLVNGSPHSHLTQGYEDSQDDVREKQSQATARAQQMLAVDTISLLLSSELRSNSATASLCLWALVPAWNCHAIGTQTVLDVGKSETDSLFDTLTVWRERIGPGMEKGLDRSLRSLPGSSWLLLPVFQI